MDSRVLIRFRRTTRQAFHTPDLVICAETNPLRNRAILLGLLGQLALDEERLLGRLHNQRENIFRRKSHISFTNIQV